MESFPRIPFRYTYLYPLISDVGPPILLLSDQVVTVSGSFGAFLVVQKGSLKFLPMIQQTQVQKQTIKIFPQQIEMLGIYHLSCLQLEQRIRDELEENPFLESVGEEELFDANAQGTDGTQDYKDWDEYAYDDIPDYKLESSNYIHTENVNFPIAEQRDFRSALKEQLVNVNFTEKAHAIAVYLVDSLSDSGFLERDLEELADDYSFANKCIVEVSEMQEVLVQLQQLEPMGVGSRSIQEFLLKQLYARKRCPVTRKAIELLEQHYSELQKRQIDKICHALNVDNEELSIVLQLISTLSLRPVNTASGTPLAKETIIPDFILKMEDDVLMVELYRQRSPHLFINQSFMESVQQARGITPEEKFAAVQLKNKLHSAMWFINAIRQREENMLRIANCIVKLQKEYFLTGDEAMIKPIILKHVADEVGLDISTVSRVTCNKYIETPFGYILLKRLFTEAIVNEAGVSVSNRVVQLKLKEIIDAEDKENPYNDKLLVALLGKSGIKIARRTVAKYRDLLNIPVGGMRRLQQKRFNTE